MAVHTPLSRQLIADFIAAYNIGELQSFSGISDGIENTNYLVSIKPANDQLPQHYILTVFENLPASDVQFYVDLMQQLASAGLPVPRPLQIPGNHSALRTLAGKPALLLNKLPGQHPQQPSTAQCRAIGTALAQQHRLTRDWQHQGARALKTILQSGATLLPALPADQQALLRDELQRGESLLNNPRLPTGVIHGDLFRDNTLFDGDQLTGLLDYYSATSGPLALDLAIAAHDWCSDGRELDALRVAVLLDGYQSVRPLTAGELELWTGLLCLAALRFWISRLHSRQQAASSADPAVRLQQKDPEDFRQRLLSLRKHLI